MHATISETAKLLGYRTRATLYRLVSQGQLDDYLWELNGKRYLFMGKKKGKTLAQEGRKATTQEIQDHKQDKRRLLNPLARIR